MVRTVQEWLTSPVLKRRDLPLPFSVFPSCSTFPPTCSTAGGPLPVWSKTRAPVRAQLSFPTGCHSHPTTPTSLCENPTHQSASPKTPSHPVRLSVSSKTQGTKTCPGWEVGSQSPVPILAQGWLHFRSETGDAGQLAEATSSEGWGHIQWLFSAS